MPSTCISSCVNDVRVPVRATYVNMYKWPESDFEFMKSISISKRGGERPTIRPIPGHPTVVDSISCRQLYLKSYTFSREEDDNETLKCLGRSRKTNSGGIRGGLKKAKDLSCSAVASVFRRLLSCTAKVDAN